MAAKISDVQRMARGQQDRRAAHVAVELGEGDQRAGEGDRADGDAERHLDQALRADRAFGADAVGVRRIKRGAGRQHGGETDQRMERRDQLRHVGHRDAPRGHRADAAADGDAADDHAPGQRVGDARDPQRGRHGERHADHAVAVAGARRRHRRRQPAQRQDEQHARNEIGDGGEIGLKKRARSLFFLPPALSSSCTSRACAR